MFENNNRKIIRKISKNISDHNKMRNMFIYLAIVLTTILLTSVIIVGLNINKNEFINYLDKDNSDNNVKTNEYVDLFNQGESIYVVKNIHAIISPKTVDKNQEVSSYEGKNVILKVPKYSNYFNDLKVKLVIGSYPKSNDEVILPKEIFDKLSITLGKEITINSTLYSSSTSRSNSTDFYRVVGVYESSDETIRDIYTGTVALAKYGSTVFVLIIILIIFSGYLFLYNIFYIHVITEKSVYELIRVLGMRCKDIRKVIFYQGIRCAIVSIPTGLILGTIIGIKIYPLVINFTGYKDIGNVSINPYMYIISFIIMIYIVYISCLKPSLYASNILEKEKNEKDKAIGISDKYSYIGKVNIKMMAFLNIFRNKKKTRLTFTSLILGALVLIFSINSYFTLDPNKSIDSILASDINISHKISDSPCSIYKPIDKKLIEELEKINEIESIIYTYEGIDVSINDDFIVSSGNKKNREMINENYIRLENGIINNSENLEYKVYGIDDNNFDEIVTKYKISNGSLDKKSFFTGNKVILFGANYSSKGSEIPIKYKLKNEIKSKTLEVEDIVRPLNGTKVKEFAVLLPINIFQEIYGNKEGLITDVEIKIKENINRIKTEEKVSDLLTKYDNDQLILKCKSSLKNDALALQKGILRAGMIITLIVGLIAILNVMNSSLTSIFARKTEFAILRAVGMKKKDVRNMIILEGVFSFAMISIPIIILGLFISIYIYLLIPYGVPLSASVILASIFISLVCAFIVNVILPYISFRCVLKRDMIEDLRNVIWY